MDVIEKQLEYLNETMKDTASEATSFLLKYHLGGLIAVISLLNIDLVLIKPSSITDGVDYFLVLVALMLIAILSRQYFSYVLGYHCKFLESHRRLKYKFELTLHLALCQGNNKEYQYFLEQSVSAEPKSVTDVLEYENANNYKFRDVAEYLLNHHRIKFRTIKNENQVYLWMAMVIIAVTVVIKVVINMI